jgi:hypothetical protein
MEDPPEADIPEFPVELALTDALEAQLAEHLELLLHSESGEGPFCEALDNSRRLAEVLGRHLETVPSQDPEALQSAIATLDSQLPGVALRAGSEGVITWHAPNQLAGYTDGNSLALLEASTDILPHPVPGWMQQETDISGCSEPSSIAEPLSRVADHWSLAAGCVRASVKQPLRDTLKDMVRTTCYCRDRTATMRDAQRLERPLERLPDLGGAQLMRALTEKMSAPKSVFGGSCSG